MGDKKHEWQLIHGNHDRQLRKALEALQTFIIDPDKKEQERALARLLEIDGKLSSRATLRLVHSSHDAPQCLNISNGKDEIQNRDHRHDEK